MLIPIPDVLSPQGVQRVRAIIDAAQWVDGNVTSGPQAALAKSNEQLPDDGAAAAEAGGIILDALGRMPLFIAAALPAKVLPPMFNRYAGGQAFGVHVDNAVRTKGSFRLRADLSATLFLADPDEYDGGELTIESSFGAQTVKLPAGHMVLYPSSSLHRVEPVTRGTRVASFFWIESMVRDGEARRALFEMDQAIQALGVKLGQGDPAIVQLTGVYHNLLRRWADS
ncbi:Fe2+-dependent dioxygenase [Sphingomonas sp. ID1715]|uniref:Fe2+-dependent dioxygenase n=1 Tax=Sphingomonas sp. ID1715 TaxID=1656898 RepID=UPI0014888B2E|nr:Fe2+-dependent dioxygenase [Sphingomonas sp. ID1715]NNM77883.1 Fe2+-dependent dioxygenase [Sphingomonas sp. ID1715]